MCDASPSSLSSHLLVKLCFCLWLFSPSACAYPCVSFFFDLFPCLWLHLHISACLYCSDSLWAPLIPTLCISFWECLSVRTYLYMCLFICMCLGLFLCVCLSVYVYVCLSLCIYLPCLIHSVFFSVCAFFVSFLQYVGLFMYAFFFVCGYMCTSAFLPLSNILVRTNTLHSVSWTSTTPGVWY